MTGEIPYQWQCPECETWVSATWWRHAHQVVDETPSLDAMIAARNAGDETAHDYVSTVKVYMRTGTELKRMTPDGEENSI